MGRCCNGEVPDLLEKVKKLFIIAAVIGNTHVGKREATWQNQTEKNMSCDKNITGAMVASESLVTATVTSWFEMAFAIVRANCIYPTAALPTRLSTNNRPIPPHSYIQRVIVVSCVLATAAYWDASSQASCGLPGLPVPSHKSDFRFHPPLPTHFPEMRRAITQKSDRRNHWYLRKTSSSEGITRIWKRTKQAS